MQKRPFSRLYPERKKGEHDLRKLGPVSLAKTFKQEYMQKVTAKGSRLLILITEKGAFMGNVDTHEIHACTAAVAVGWREGVRRG